MSSYSSPPSSVYSFATSTRSNRNAKSMDFSYSMGDHPPTSRW